MTLLLDLPDEIFVSIAAHVVTEDLLNVCCTGSRFYRCLLEVLPRFRQMSIALHSLCDLDSVPQLNLLRSLTLKRTASPLFIDPAHSLTEITPPDCFFIRSVQIREAHQKFAD